MYSDLKKRSFYLSSLQQLRSVKALLVSFCYFAFISLSIATASAQSQNEVQLERLFDGVDGAGENSFSSDPLDDGNGAHTPGLDQNGNNRVVRLRDSYGVIVYWNINEAAAENVRLIIEIPENSIFTPDNTGIFSGCGTSSVLSADQRTFTCELGSQTEGSSGSIRPIAQLVSLESGDVNVPLEDGSRFGITASLLTDDDLTGNINDTLGASDDFVISEAPQVDYIKGEPTVFPPVTVAGELGRVVVFPLSVVDNFQSRSVDVGVGPIDDAVPIVFYDHAWEFPSSVRLAGADQLAASGTGGVGGSECDVYSQTGVDAGPYATTPASVSCLEALGAGNYSVTQVTVSGFSSRPFPTTLADGSINDIEAPAVLGLQIAYWFPESVVQAALGGSPFASFFNSIARQDGTTVLNATSDVIEIEGQGNAGPTTFGPIENNSVQVGFGTAPVPAPGSRAMMHDIRFMGGPLALFEYNVATAKAQIEDRIPGSPNLMPTLRAADSRNHGLLENGIAANRLPTVARSQLLTIKAQFRGRTSSVGEFFDPIAGCMGFDNSHYNLTDLPSQITVSESDQTARDAIFDPVISSTRTIAPSDGLAHVLTGEQRTIFMFENTVASLALKDVDYVLEFSNQPLPRNAAGVASVADDALTCNDADSGTSGWISARNNAAQVSALFDSDGDGLYEGITRARVRVLDRDVDWAGSFWQNSAFPPDRGGPIAGQTLHVFLQARVLDDVNVNTDNQELFAFASHAYEPASTIPDPASYNATTTECIPSNQPVWMEQGNNLTPTTGWCNKAFEDVDGTSPLPYCVRICRCLCGACYDWWDFSDSKQS